MHTHALWDFSPAIDAGFGGGALPSADARGMGRYDDQNVFNTGNGSPLYVDIGAYERQSDSDWTLAVSTLIDERD